MRAIVTLGLVIGLGLVQPAAAGEGVVRSVGAATCGSFTCHAAETPWPNSAVTQKEYLVWQEKDPHSRAYQVLTTAKANRISRGMGLGRAEGAGLCLGCHSHNPPPSKTEETFDHTVGVGCEGCHGPSSGWLGVHQAGLYFYQRNIDEGMYPTTDPQKRAELCLSCHVGTRDKFVTHRMLALGHPRLPFELGFYTWFNEATPGRLSDYAHFKVDDDYLQRKPWPFGVKVWAVGQAVQAETLLDLLLDPKVGQTQGGLFPEFAFFECHSCHGKSLGGEGANGGYGLPRLNDANLFFVEVAAGLVSPNLARQIRGDVTALRAAEGKSWPEIREAVRSLRNRMRGLTVQLAKHEFDENDTRLALARIAEGAAEGKFRSYIANEQAVYAAGSLIDELEKLEQLSPRGVVDARAAIKRGLAAFVSVDTFRAGQVRSALSEAARIANRR